MKKTLSVVAVLATLAAGASTAAYAQYQPAPSTPAPSSQPGMNQQWQQSPNPQWQQGSMPPASHGTQANMQAPAAQGQGYGGPAMDYHGSSSIYQPNYSGSTTPPSSGMNSPGTSNNMSNSVGSNGMGSNGMGAPKPMNTMPSASSSSMQQPGMQQPGMQQPGMQQPGMQGQGYGGPAMDYHGSSSIYQPNYSSGTTPPGSSGMRSNGSNNAWQSSMNGQPRGGAAKQSGYIDPGNPCGYGKTCGQR